MQTLTKHAEPEATSAHPERLREALLATFFPPAPARPDLPLRTLAILLGIGPGAAPRTVAGLAEELGLPRDQLRRGLESLVRWGLAVRRDDAAGKRGALVVATEAGLRIIQDMSGARPAQA
jgi:hypothetical protein